MIQQNLLQMIQAEKVEWKTLGEVCQIKKGKQLNKTELKDQGLYPAYNGGKGHSGYTDNFNVEADTIIISQGGASAGFVNFIKVPFWANAHCYYVLPHSNIINRYLYHFLKNNERSFMDSQYGAGIPALSQSALEKVAIPIPPLETQQKIVKILDKMTELEATLEAELSQRRRQYEYYRNALLDFDNRAGGVIAKFYPDCLKDVAWKTLGEVAEYSTMRIKADSLDETSYVGVDNLLQNRGGKTLASYAPNTESLAGFVEGDILIGNIRPYLKKIWQADRAGGASGDVLIIHTIDKDVNPRYLYQVLADDKFFTYNMQHAKGAKMPRGSKAAIMQYSFPIPPLEIQAKIVAILDQFDTLTQSISQGLPREIALRRKQYEYYREQLLNFAPAA